MASAGGEEVARQPSFSSQDERQPLLQQSSSVQYPTPIQSGDNSFALSRSRPEADNLANRKKSDLDGTEGLGRHLGLWSTSFLIVWRNVAYSS